MSPPSASPAASTANLPSGRAYCQSSATEWYEASGEGTVYSYSVMRRTETPFVIAYVTLAEGVTMMTNIVDCAQTPEALELDMPLEVVFEKATDDITLPKFRPATS